MCDGKHWLRIACAAFLACAGLVAMAADPVVSNVRVAQRPGTGILDITYDLADPDSDILSVAINISTNDGVSWFSPVASNLSGAVGTFNVSTGISRVITWQGWHELPSQLLKTVKAQVRAADSPYLVFDLSGGTNATSYPMTILESAPVGGWTDDFKTTKLVVRRFLAGTFLMSSPESEVGRFSIYEDYQHPIRLSHDYYIGLFEVTQRQWEFVMGNKPSAFSNVTCYATRPVEKVSYFDVREDPNNSAITPNWPASSQVHSNSFMGRLRSKTGCSTFDLPTEAQWEYACRAGTTTALNTGVNLADEFSDSNMNLAGRYWNNGGGDSYVTNDTSGGTAEVGSYAANSAGLFDAHGNVGEWCLDWYRMYNYLGSPSIDPRGAVSGYERVVRGGDFFDYACRCRSAARDSCEPDTRSGAIGLRVCLPLGDPAAGTFEESPSVIYDLSHYILVVGVPVSAVGATGAVQVVTANSGDGCVSIQLGGEGLLGEGDWAGIEWSVQRSGTISFDWQVSSEAENDLLRFYEVGGGATNAISGMGDGWTHVSATVTGMPGTKHVFRWEYVKGSNGNFAGLDCGWIDAVSWLPLYALAVDNGVGDGSYTNGTIVTVTADAPPPGGWFNCWTGTIACVASVTSATTSVIMPTTDVSIAATYVVKYALTVDGGTGGGSYTNGQRVTVIADAPPLGMRFDHWTGATECVASVTSSTTMVTMPASDIALAAAYVEVYALTVVDGAGGGSYTNGQPVTITANPPAVGKVFDCWIGATLYVENVTSATTKVIMPATGITVSATYKDVYYTLTVTNGVGGGSYTNGQRVTVTADVPPPDYRFERWTGAMQYMANVTSSTTQVTMPASDITVSAVYIGAYSLTVIGGTGGGSYTNGQRVAIIANAQTGMVFNQWTGDTGFVADVFAPSTTVAMPALGVTVTATYKPMLPESRVLLFDDYALTNNAPTPTWVHQGPNGVGLMLRYLLAGTNHFHRTGWRLLSCRTGTARGMGLVVAPSTATNLAANLQNTLGAQIESPIFREGIGTIYFEAINNIEPTQITVEIATNMVSLVDPLVFGPLNPSATNEYAYNWMTLDVPITLNAASANDFTRYVKLLNYRQPVILRICRTGTVYTNGYRFDDALTVIDNIRVSLPPSDVVISKPECLFEPGYPAVNTNLTIRCAVSNAYTNAPTVARAVKVCTRWRYLDQVIGTWRTNDMAYVEGTGDGQGNGEVYKAVLSPQSEVGDLEYFFICAFDGVNYISEDYTQTRLNGYPYPSELPSPRTLRGAPSDYSVRLRPYASEFGMVYVESDQHAGPIGMTLVGDGVWRGLVPVGGLGLTNLTWRFKGVCAFEPGADAFATGVTYWAGAGPAGARCVPHSGVCAEDDGSGRLGLSVDSGGYVMLTLNTRTLEYQASRAEYQNFNTWPARSDVFSESSSQATQQRYMNTFDGWPTNVEQTFKEPVASAVSSTNIFSRGPFLTPQSWKSGSAAFAADRLEADYNNKPVGVLGFRNLALRLKGGDGALGLGYIHNQVATRPDGLKQISFKCRLAQSASKLDVAYNQTELAKTNYLVRADTRVYNPTPPEQPSVSLIGYYRDPDNFYEYRITQMPDPANKISGQDKLTTHQLFKWVNGVPTQLGNAVSRVDTSTLLANGIIGMEMRLFTTSSSSTRIRCKYGTVDDVLDRTDSVSPISGGTYGFLSAEGFAGFSSVITQPTSTGAVATGVATSVLSTFDTYVFDIQKLNWYTPSGRYEATRRVSPYGIYSVIPTQKIGVYLQETDFNSADEPAVPESPLWKKVQEITVPDFGYTSVVVPVNSWKSQFVKVQVLGGLADVVVDELAVSSWRGKQSGSGATNDWLATEAWVVSNSTAQANVVQLDRSRADPAAAQGVRSMLLRTGLGAMALDYRVLRPPAKLTVQYSLEATPQAWSDVTSFVVTNVTGWTHVSAYLGRAEPGYFRVINNTAGGYTNALVELNDVTVWDQPSLAPTDWRAYNAKITETDLARVALDQTKACFLNNSATLEADPLQDQSAPYLQSPVLPTGLGSLSFYARAYATNQTATVFVYASTNGWNAASNQWFEVYRFENITNTLYRLYSYEQTDGRDYDAIRLMTQTSGGARRVCLEEVVVSEPLFSDADIVSLCAGQPNRTYATSDTNIDFTVRLAGRFALRKSDPEASAGLYPELGMVVNSDLAWAQLRNLSAFETPQGWRTEAVFSYTVKPGDMAEPLKLFGPVGSGRSGNAYSFAWHGWEIFNQDTTSNAVWHFNPPRMVSGDVYDLDLSRAGVVLKTLAFNAAMPDTVGATETVTGHIKTDRAVGDAPVSFNVWSSDTNIVRVGALPGQGVLTLTLGTGETDAAFTLCGVTPGRADLYVQRVHDYENNSTLGVMNFIRRSITVIPPPLQRWGEVAGTLTGGGTYRMYRCETDAGGVSVVCNGGGAGSVFRFISDRNVAFTNLTLSISNGATVVIEDLNIDNQSVEGLSAVCAADGHPENTLALVGRNAVWGGRMAAGVNVQARTGGTNALSVISGAGTNGTLTALGGVLAAGIGGDPFEAGGSVSVCGHAVVTALGGDFGAGVGGGIAAAGGSVEVTGQALLLATGGGGGARDVGPGAYSATPAKVRFTGGLILSGTGADGVSEFVTGLHHSSWVGEFNPVGWCGLSRNGGPELGRLYVAASAIGVHSISNVTQAGVYTLTSENGGGTVTFEIVRAGPVVPAGVHGDAAFYGPWLQKHGLESADLSVIEPAAFDAAWLLDQNPQGFVAGELAITGVQVGAGTIRGTYTVRAVADGGTQTVTHLNGRLVVLGTGTLANGFAEIVEITDSVGTGNYAFEIPCLTGVRFIKIEVVFP